MTARIAFTAVSITALLMSGCAIEGIPAGLTPLTAGNGTGFPQTGGLTAVTLATNMVVAENLRNTYQRARDENLHYAFWSNAALFPVAAGGATAVVTKSPAESIALIGVAAGSMVGFNGFVNARANAKTYQSGYTAITCTIVNLQAYRDTAASPPPADSLAAVWQRARTIDTGASSFLNAIKDQSPGTTALTAAQSADFVAAQTQLEQAIVAAKTAIDNQAAALQLYNQLGTFSANSILQIDALVEAKISQTDVNYTTLLSSLTASPPAAPGANAAAGAGGHGPARAPVGNQTPPSATSVIDGLITTTAELTAETARLDRALNAFTLSAQESAVEACIKAM